MSLQKYLIVILGPTAVGKTAFAIRLASAFHTEIMSADSRQFFKELNIGVAKPSPEQLSTIKHHFVGHIGLDNKYTIADFERDAIAFTEEFFQQKDVLIMVGGSGLYIDAICNGIDEMPAISTHTRTTVDKLFKEKGLAHLLSILKEKDKKYYDEVDKSNSRRVVRAVEIITESGQAFSDFRTKNKKVRNFNLIKIGLELPREEMYERIDKRVEDMIKNGLIEEVQSLRHLLPNKNLDTIGYRELFELSDEKEALKKAIELIQQHTRQFAKRQLTWFRRDQSIEWFQPEEIASCLSFIEQKMKTV